MGDFMVFFWVLGGVVAAGIVGVLTTAHRANRRWGKITASVPAGDGAYREGDVTAERARGTPVGIRIAAIASITWAIITLLVFVPAGGLLALAGFDFDHSNALGLFSLVISASGLALGISLVTVALRLVRRSPEAAATSTQTARFCYGHHAAVWIGFSVAAIADHAEGAPPIMLALALPCVIGALVGHQIQRAGEATRKIDELEIKRLAAALL